MVAQPLSGKTVRFGAFELDLEAQQLRKAGALVRLQPHPFKVLAALVCRPGGVVTREELRREVWGDETFVDFEQGLNFCIRQIRVMLGDEAQTPQFIETIPRRGYRFVGPVKQEQIDTDATVTSSPAGKSKELPAASLAVVPFVFLGTGEESECLSLGFADALITALGNLEDLTVPPTAAILKFPSGSDPAEACRTLRVRHVLQGNIQKLGNHWRVSVQLFDSQAGKITFSDKFAFTLENVFDVQDKIGHCVARSLARQFRRAARKIRTRFSANSSACDAFLKGLRDSYSQDPEGLDRSISELAQAVQHDPDFALAHATLSHVYTSKHFGFDPRRRWLEKAEFHCRRALELDPDLAEGHVANAYILWSQAKNFQHLEAISEIQKALALQPNLDHAYNRLGNICAHIGRLKESQNAYEKAQSIDRQNLSNHNVVYSYLWGGEWQDARQELDVWLAENPGNKMALWLWAQPAVLSGDLECARGQLALAMERFPTEPLILSLRGLLHALSGEGEQALEYVRRTCESPRSFGHSHHSHYQIACVYSVLGEKQKAFDWFERSVDGGFACWPFFRRDPNLKNLQGLPEFRTMVDDLETKFAHIELKGL